MTLAEATASAASLALVASIDACFCTLRRPGGGIAARGNTFEEAFQRLEAAQTRTSTQPAPLLPPEPAEPGRLF